MAKDHVALRLEPEDVDRVKALKARMTGGGLEPSQSDVLRVLVLDALPRLEMKHGIKAPVSIADPMRRKGAQS